MKTFFYCSLVPTVVGVLNKPPVGGLQKCRPQTMWCHLGLYSGIPFLAYRELQPTMVRCALVAESMLSTAVLKNDINSAVIPLGCQS